MDEQLSAWLRPFWSGKRSDDEPVFFIQGDGPPQAPLLFTPRGKVKLTAANGSAVYEEGRDFTVEGKNLALTPGSKIPFKTRAQMYPPAGSPQSIGTAVGGKSHLFFGEGHVFHDLQAVASYRHGDTWTGPKPRSAARQLPRTLEKLRRREPVKLVALGDSISAGGNASGMTGSAPHQPAYPELTAKALHLKFGGEVGITNLSVGGMASDWGIGEAGKAIAAAPDLMLIAFGMNDASGRRTPADFAGNIAKTMADVRKGRPECEFLLVATMTGNAEWSYAAPDLYPLYRDALRALTGQGVALADVTTLWSAVLERKRYADLTGNGVNHPNDFGHRIYAHTVLATLGAA